MQDIIDYDIRCPISKQIFKNPVVCEDGFTYEKEMIDDWFIVNNVSPSTHKYIDKIYHRNIVLEKIIEYIIKLNPQLKKDVYITNFDENKFYNLYKDNKINLLIEYISDYDTFDITYNDLLDDIFKNNIITKMFIDKNINIINDTGCKLIHFICCYSTPEMIKYILDNTIKTELEIEDSNKWRPIHYICIYSTEEMIKYIIDRCVDLEAKNDDGMRPIHYICKYSNPEVIKYIIDKGVDLEMENNEGWKPIHFIAYYSTIEMLRYIISKGVSTTNKIKRFNNKKSKYTIDDLIKKRQYIDEEDYKEDYKEDYDEILNELEILRT